MNNIEEFGYFAKTVSARIGVAKDTLRNWSLKLESDGVTFERNTRGQRIYYEKDIRAFQNMKELLDLQQPLNDVSKIIAEKFQRDDYTKLESENNTEIMFSVSHEENGLITQENQMDKFKNDLLKQFADVKIENLEKFKKEVAEEMAEVMQERFEDAVKEAIKMAFLKERKSIVGQVVEELKKGQLAIASNEAAAGLDAADSTIDQKRNETDNRKETEQVKKGLIEATKAWIKKKIKGS